MAKVIKLSDTHTIEQEAAEWIVRLDGGDADDNAIEDFNTWLRKDSRHRTEFVRFANLCGGMVTLSTMAELIPLKDIEIRNITRHVYFPNIEFNRLAFGEPDIINVH